MKKFFLILFLLMVLIGGGVFYVIHTYVSVEKITAIIKEEVKKKTGRDIAFSGVRLLPYPNLDLALRLQNVTFSNAPWASEKVMASLGELELRLALKPLLDKQVVITKFLLDKPVINLEVSSEGQKNWEFPQLKEEKTEPAEKKASGNSTVDNFTKDISFKFSQLEIKRGQLAYIDRKTPAGALLDKIDITITYPDLSSGIQVDGWLEYERRRVNVFAALDRPRDLLAGKTTGGKLILKSEGLAEVSATGNFATSGTMLSGKVSAKVASLADFAAWYSAGLKTDLPFTKLEFSSNTVFSLKSLQLKGAQLALDEVKAAGDVTLGLSAAKPEFTARMSLNKLNLDRFTGVEVDASGKSAGAAKKPAKEDWDDKPIDFSGLKAVNADLVLKTEGFSLRGAEVGPSTLTVLLKNGNLQFKSSEATLFGGKFSSSLGIDGGQATPSMSFNFGMEGVDAKPVLATFADFDKLSGKAHATVAVTSAGKSQKSIIGNLDGNGKFNFKNGAIHGIDLVDMMKKIQSRLAEMGVGEGKTEFVDLGGTFTIANGVAKNSDLAMRGPLVQATGNGTVDLPRKWVNYRALPVLTASSGVEGAKGLKVPVDIRGPFHNIKAKPDYADMIKNIAPEDVKETVKNVKDNFKDIKKDFKEDPGAAIENLLGGGGLFGKKKKAAPQEEAPVAP